MKITVVKEVPRGAKPAMVEINSTKDSAVLVLPDGRKSISLGIGEPKELNLRKFQLIPRQIIALAKANKIKKLAIPAAALTFRKLRLPEKEAAEILATNIELANFEFIKYKTPPPEGWNFVEEVLFVAPKNVAPWQQGVAAGQTIAGEVNRARILSNTPGGEMTPRLLAKEAYDSVKNLPVTVTILGKKEMKSLGMGGILGVAQGSVEDPQFIVMEYFKGKKKDKPVVLVGKGITFDTGGLNLKPSDGIYEMHMDMSGGAAVIHAVALAAKLGIKKNIVGLIPAAENMPSGSSYRPGDILRSMSGKTIEVLNTDAEGRIVLADALTYAKKYNPKLVIDVATLTGAAMVALGQRASAIFTADAKLETKLRAFGEISGDYVWPLPLWEEYESDIKGTFGDVANANKTRYGGAINGAMFLYQFAKEFPWVHLDIAPRMTSVDGDFLAKGAIGAPVRLLLKIVKSI